MNARAWMQGIDRKIWSALAEFLFLSVLAMLVPVAIWADMRLFNDGYSEMPCTELSQEIFVLISALIFAVEASRRAHARGFLILVAGFFASLLVREGDAYLDRWVFQSFWIWPASLIAISSNPIAPVAYGRYWGALKRVDCLHFEACFYQPLQWCIQHGFHRFEGGAQGEHKMARALMPVKTHSAHWLAHPAFADAVERFLEREGTGIENYLETLAVRSPFRQPAKPVLGAVTATELLATSVETITKNRL